MSASEPTVFIVEDDAAVRGSLALLLSLHGLRTMVFGSAEEFLEAARPASPGCLVLDLRMPGMGGLELLARLQAQGLALPTLVITAHGDVASARASFKSGAVDFFEKPIDHDALLAAIRAALDRDRLRHVEAAEAGDLAERLARLTGREREVLERVAGGMHNREIASALGISPRTVEVYKARVMDKLGVSRVPDLVRLMVRHGRGSPRRE